MHRHTPLFRNPIVKLIYKLLLQQTNQKMKSFIVPIKFEGDLCIEGHESPIHIPPLHDLDRLGCFTCPRLTSPSYRILQNYIYDTVFP